MCCIERTWYDAYIVIYITRSTLEKVKHAKTQCNTRVNVRDAPMGTCMAQGLAYIAQSSLST